MENFDKPFSNDPTGLPSSNNGNNTTDPALLDGTTTPELFGFDDYLTQPLEGEIALPYEYPDPDEGLMHRDFREKIEFDDYYNSESSGKYINPAVVSSSSGVYQGQASLTDDFNGESSGIYVDPAIGDLSLDLGQGRGRGQSPLSPIPIYPTFLHLEAQKAQYLNAILNHFSSPVTPLQVIDKVKYPFEQQLQSALEEELARERERELEARDEAALRNHSEITPPALSPGAKRMPGVKKALNKRPDNIRNFDPAQFYEPLQFRPSSWGSINLDTGDILFQYTEHGELNPLHAFTVDQIVEYIGQHPLHNPRGTKKSQLKLWIQTVPADSGRRYPDKLSDKCRFADCPDTYRTIRKGEFRVTFDEQPLKRDRETDPFHNAGYVHLYCLEKFVDFPQLCKQFNVVPDTRKFREGKNRMAITRDHESMAGIVREFIAHSEPWPQFTPKRPEEVYGQRPEEYYIYTLSSALTQEHLNKQPKHLQKIREMREGNSIDIHKNNLDKRVQNAKQLKENKRLGLVEPKPKLQKRKVAEMVEEDEEFVPDENILAASPRPKRQKSESSNLKPTKRRQQSASSSRVTKGRRTRSMDTVHSLERRRTRSLISIPSPKKLKEKEGSFTPSTPKKRRSEDAEPSPGSKRRRSPRSPKKPRTPGTINWTGGFRTSGLPF